jgi:hypothetical protein
MYNKQKVSNPRNITLKLRAAPVPLQGSAKYSMPFVLFIDSHNADRECEGWNMQHTWQKREIHSEFCHKTLNKDTIKETPA